MVMVKAKLALFLMPIPKNSVPFHCTIIMWVGLIRLGHTHMGYAKLGICTPVEHRNGV